LQNPRIVYAIADRVGQLAPPLLRSRLHHAMRRHGCRRAGRSAGHRPLSSGGPIQRQPDHVRIGSPSPLGQVRFRIVQPRRTGDVQCTHGFFSTNSRGTRRRDRPAVAPPMFGRSANALSVVVVIFVHRERPQRSPSVLPAQHLALQLLVVGKTPHTGAQRHHDARSASPRPPRECTLPHA